ncbi:SCP2 sterol-binding domain-containing protein, partial [Oleiphilus sp. HI0080]
EGDHDDPSVTLIMSTETLNGIVSGETDGMQAFMAGQLRAEGDMMLATKLGELFSM